MHTPQLRTRLISLLLSTILLVSVTLPVYAANPASPIADDLYLPPFRFAGRRESPRPTPTPVPPEERVELATTHIAEPTGIEPPSRYGPSVNDPNRVFRAMHTRRSTIRQNHQPVLPADARWSPTSLL